MTCFSLQTFSHQHSYCLCTIYHHHHVLVASKQVEAENHCTSQMRLLIDQISVQQGQIVALQGSSIQMLLSRRCLYAFKIICCVYVFGALSDMNTLISDNFALQWPRVYGCNYSLASLYALLLSDHVHRCVVCLIQLSTQQKFKSLWRSKRSSFKLFLNSKRNSVLVFFSLNSVLKGIYISIQFIYYITKCCLHFLVKISISLLLSLPLN